jgi:hypothetical protein
MSEPNQRPKPKPEPVWANVGPGGVPTISVVSPSGREGTIQELEAGQTIGDDFYPLKNVNDPKTKLPPPDPNTPPNSPTGLADYYLAEARKALAAGQITQAKNFILGVKSMISMVKVMAEKGKNTPLAEQMMPYEKRVAEFDAFFEASASP